LNQPGTILTRKSPEGNALDVVRVVCRAPVNATEVPEWKAAGGPGDIVEPHEDFGPSQVMPDAIAEDQYEVTGYPEEPLPVTFTPKQRAEAQLTPEQVFARDAKDAAQGKPAKSTSTRAKTTIGGKQ